MLHNKTNGYLHNKTAEALANEIHRLAELEPDDVPHDSRFLLEMDTGLLTKMHVETQAYWVIAVIAATKAKAKQSAMGAGAKRRAKRLAVRKTSSREKLVVVKVERQIFRDRLRNQACGEETLMFEEHDQRFLDEYVVKKPH